MVKIQSRLALALHRLERKFGRLDNQLIVSIFIGLGFLLRIIHFLRQPSIWQDEAALLINISDLSFAQMIGALSHHQAAPPLYLMLERLLLVAFGDHILVLRLPSLLASCGALLLFAALARRVLQPNAAVWAIGLFAVSDRLLWHSVEVKPYALDVFVAVAIAYTYVRLRWAAVWLQSLVWLLILPVTLWLSYPACFLAGAVLISVGISWLRERRLVGALAFAGLVAAVGSAFLLLALGPIAAQRDASLDRYWNGTFANWQRPWTIPWWAVTRTLNLLTYSMAPQGWLLCGVVAAGAIGMVRKDRQMAWFLAIPLGLIFAAGLVGKYPYDGSRVTVFVCPALCLFAGAGIPPAWEWLRRRQRWAPLLLGICLALPFLHTLHRSIRPWDRAAAEEAVGYVLSHCREQDSLAFNNWECEYYLRTRAGQWIKPTDCPEQSQQMWYVALSNFPAERDQLLKSVSPCWTLEERIEFRHISVGRYRHLQTTPAGAHSTSPVGLVR